MEPSTVLLVEDNLKILDANRRILEEDGLAVQTAASLAQARQRLAERIPDVVVLDIMLPDGDGLAFLAELRECCDAPVLFLTAKGERSDRLAGLRAGGNDYITKPYDIDEFRARVAAFVRLAANLRKQERFTLDALEFDIVHQRVTAAGQELALTRREFGVLLYLARNTQRAVGAQELYEAVWRKPLTERDSTIKSTLSHLRGKLEGTGWQVVSTRGEGYRLAAPE